MNSAKIQTEVVVVGSGPAGLALTTHLLSRGVDVKCVAPSLAPWVPTYGAWLDEVQHLDVPVDRVWQRAQISFPRRESIILDHPYVRLDASALQHRWSAQLYDADAFIPGVVSSVLFSGDSAEIELDTGMRIRASTFFDAAGHSASFVQRGPVGHAYQTAFGLDVAYASNTLSSDTMGVMLWDDGLMIDGVGASKPAFYYVMPSDGGNAFVEYTVLASRPLVSPDLLEARVTADHGSDKLESSIMERCVIPMGHAVPPLDQPAIGFGGAASMVHPATGYMLARVLATAPAVADAVVAMRGQPLGVRSRACWDVIWPSDRVRTHELFRFGLEALLTMNVSETHAFFAAFFSLPDEMWRGYQSGTASPREVAETMLAVFAAADTGLKLKLARAGFGRHAGKLLRLVY